VLHINPHEGQRRALASKKQIVAMLCGKQSGKSILCPLWLYQRILDWDKEVQTGDAITDATFWAVSPSYPLQDEKLQPTFYDFFVSTLGIGKYHVQKKRLDVTITREDGTNIIYGIKFKSADKPESLASASVAALVCDEAGQDAFSQAAWEECRARIGSTGGRILITTTLYNYGWIRHLIFDEWKRGNPDIDVIQFKSIMNPFFSKGEWDNAKRMMPDWKFQMSYCGQFARPLGQIYEHFNESCIVEPFDISPISYKFVGIDPGITHHSTVWLAELCPDQIEYHNFPLADGITPIYVIYDSSLMGSTITTLTNKEHADALMMHRDFPMLKTASGGAASEIYFRADYQAAGIDVIKPPFKEVSAGIDVVSALLKTHRLYIFSNQKRLIREFEEYAYKLDIEGEVTPVIQDKERFHGLDSVRYCCGGIDSSGARAATPFLSMSGKSLLDI
jgi:phage terminase large subunit